MIRPTATSPMSWPSEINRPVCRVLGGFCLCKLGGGLMLRTFVFVEVFEIKLLVE